MTDVNKNASEHPGKQWQEICALNDLPVDAGIAALLNEDMPGEQQIALFRISNGSATTDQVYAISNLDPFSEANVLARGIVCSIDGELAVASPVLKQHFSLETGKCPEDEAVFVSTYPTKIIEGRVLVNAAAREI